MSAPVVIGLSSLLRFFQGERCNATLGGERSIRLSYEDIYSQQIYFILITPLCQEEILFIPVIQDIIYSGYPFQKINENLPSASARKSSGKVGLFGENCSPNFKLIYRRRFGTSGMPSPTAIQETFVFSRRYTACRVRSSNQTLPIKM